MAKIALSKLVPNKVVESKTIQIGDETIAVLQYLPINEKTQMIERILAAIFDDTGFASPVRIQVYMMLEIVKAYTNINITDKMMENAGKTYDALVINNILSEIINNIPETEYNELQTLIYQCINRIETYNSSFVGMIKAVAQDYDATKINVDEIMNTLDQPEKIDMVKQVLDKIG